MPTFKAAIDSFAAAVDAALDGGKKAIAERNRQQDVVIKMLRQLARYVEIASKDDITMFLSSGFDLRPSGRTKAQPLSQFIRRIDRGENSGQMQVSVTAFQDAYSYQVRWSPANTGGAEPTWTIRSIGKTQPPVTIESLTGHGLCFSGSCLNRVRLYRLERSCHTDLHLDRVAAKALSPKCGRGPKRSLNNHFSLAAKVSHYH